MFSPDAIIILISIILIILISGIRCKLREIRGKCLGFSSLLNFASPDRGKNLFSCLLAIDFRIHPLKHAQENDFMFPVVSPSILIIAFH